MYYTSVILNEDFGSHEVRACGDAGCVKACVTWSLSNRELLSGLALKTPLSAAEERAPHRGPVLILIFNHSVNVFSFNNSLCLHQSFLSSVSFCFSVSIFFSLPLKMEKPEF